MLSVRIVLKRPVGDPGNDLLFDSLRGFHDYVSLNRDLTLQTTIALTVVMNVMNNSPSL